MTLSLGSLSKDVFEQRTSTGSEAFSLFICFDTNKFVLLSFFSLIKTIYPRVSTKPLPNDAKSPLPVDDRRSKTRCLSSLLTTTAHLYHLSIKTIHGNCVSSHHQSVLTKINVQSHPTLWAPAFMDSFICHWERHVNFL